MVKFNCSRCLNSISDDNFVQCQSGCKLYFHSKCIGLELSTLKVIKTSTNLFWFCDSCSSIHTHGLLSKLNVVSEQLKSISDDVAALREIKAKNSLKTTVNAEAGALEGSPLQQHSTVKKKPANAKQNKNQNKDNLSIINKKTLVKEPERDKIKAASVDDVDVIRAAPTNISVHLQHLDKYTSVEAILKHSSNILSISQNEMKCFKLIKKDADLNALKSVSFLLILPSTFYKKISNKKHWPYGVHIKKFVYKQKSDNNVDENEVEN